MSHVEFEHKMAAHCETGTIVALLASKGLVISEPMVFGIAGGIFFGYLQTPKLSFPMVITRSQPGQIRKNIAKRLGVRFCTRTFSRPEKARQALDKLLSEGQPVAVQVDMFNMDYIPSYMRVHFNGHFVTVVGKNGGTYTVSDSYHPRISSVGEESLMKGRFARGDLAPRGLLFYPQHVPAHPDLREPIRKGIRQACFNMLKIPIPFLGVKGIRYFARKLTSWPKLARDTEYLSHQVMMISVILEDRGTGGAGFRFMYATFLQQAANFLQNPSLSDLSKEMMSIGDRWREIALFSARIGKNRDLGPERLTELSSMIMRRADDEEKFFSRLGQIAL